MHTIIMHEGSWQGRIIIMDLAGYQVDPYLSLYSYQLSEQWTKVTTKVIIPLNLLFALMHNHDLSHHTGSCMLCSCITCCYCCYNSWNTPCLNASIQPNLRPAMHMAPVNNLLYLSSCWYIASRSEVQACLVHALQGFSLGYTFFSSYCYIINNYYNC